MKKSLLLAAVVFAFAGTTYVMQLAPTAVINIEGKSPQELENEGRTTHTSTGLDVVGVGSLVYLSGADADGEEVTVFAWELTDPAGAPATLDSVGTAWNTFRPAMVGVYTVNLTVTTASGEAAVATSLTSAEYVGVGGVGGITPIDFRAGQCAACHSGNEADWNATGHASKFARAVDGINHGFYRETCNECHTVGYDLTAVNGGYDDVAAAAGYVLPETLQDGNWADVIATYPSVAQKANIQCENCHGPGSMHKGDTSKIAVTLDEAVCSSCHEAEPYHGIGVEWNNSLHANGTTFARGTSSSCAPCHSGYGFVAKVDPLSDLDQKTGNQNVSCATCHDPHDATNEHQLRTIDNVELQNGEVITWGGKGKLCMNCHQSRRDAATYVEEYHRHFGPHYNPQADMLAATNVITFGRYIASTPHRDALPNTCVSCHMSEAREEGEPGFRELGGHTWKMHLVNDDGRTDLHEDGEFNTAACERCHGAMETFDDLMARSDYDGDGTTESARQEVHGMLDKVGMMLPPLGDPSVSVADDFSPVQLKTAYNHAFVEDDQSHGLHNFQFAIGLLQVTYDVLTYGVLTEGDIMEVTDVPNDQGKQVQVVWSRFGGDGPSDDPIDSYYVWRRDNSAASKMDRPVVEGFDSIPSEPAEASKVALSVFGDVWTMVGFQPAAQMAMYSAVVPTLADSTAEGVVMTDFMVSARTVNLNSVNSLPMSGYSFDNLVPGVPTGLKAMSSATEVVLTWDDASDADLAYFVVNRNDGTDDTEVGMASAATFTDTDVMLGATYTYSVAAVDFGGNRGDFSEGVVAAVATSNEDPSDLPVAFALNGNYPNPFNPTTTIAYDVPAASEMTIGVYDLLGRRVSLLVNGTVPAGRHTVQFNAERMSSGLYLVRMTTGNRVFERSIVLVK